jgi:hypothetical protein
MNVPLLFGVDVLAADSYGTPVAKTHQGAKTFPGKSSERDGAAIFTVPWPTRNFHQGVSQLGR